jgi:hypothetical protein
MSAATIQQDQLAPYRQPVTAYWQRSVRTRASALARGRRGRGSNDTARTS